MNQLKKILLFVLFIPVFINMVKAQSTAHADEYTKLADDLRKNLKPDSAII